VIYEAQHYNQIMNTFTVFCVIIVNYCRRFCFAAVVAAVIWIMSKNLG